LNTKSTSNITIGFRLGSFYHFFSVTGYLKDLLKLDPDALPGPQEGHKVMPLLSAQGRVFPLSISPCRHIGPAPPNGDRGHQVTI
jgi:hypothetical protein